jgi:hypothetical protein
MVIGFGMQSLLLGYFMQTLQQIDIDDHEVQQKIETLKRYFREYPTSGRNLFNRIKRHIQRTQNLKTYHDSQQFMSILPI